MYRKCRLSESEQRLVSACIAYSQSNKGTAFCALIKRTMEQAGAEIRAEFGDSEAAFEQFRRVNNYIVLNIINRKEYPYKIMPIPVSLDKFLTYKYIFMENMAKMLRF